MWATSIISPKPSDGNTHVRGEASSDLAATSAQANSKKPGEDSRRKTWNFLFFNPVLEREEAFEEIGEQEKTRLLTRIRLHVA